MKRGKESMGSESMGSEHLILPNNQWGQSIL